MEILVLCSGNIHRSPAAEGLLRKILGDIGVRNVVVSSAGTLRIEGEPASPEAIRLGQTRGFDLTKHRSRGVSGRILERADLIVVMEQAHLREVSEIDPAAGARTRLLTEYDPGGRGAYDIMDPVGGKPEDFERCFEIIDRCVVNLAFDLKYRHGP